MRNSTIILYAVIVIMFEAFLLKYQTMFMNISRTISLFDLGTIQYITYAKPSEAGGIFSALTAFFDAVLWFIQLIWWIIRAGAAFVYLMLQLIVTFISISLEFPILWFVNAPVIILLIYVAVSLIKILGSSVGGGGD